MFQRAIEILSRILFFISGTALIASVALAFAAVIMRYIFNFSLEWIEEGARYLALFAAFLVAGPVLRDRGHIALDLFAAGLTGTRQHVHRLVSGLIAIAAGVAIFLWGMELWMQSYEYGLLTGSLQFPQWLPYSIVPLGMALLVLFALAEVVASLQAMRGPPPSTKTIQAANDPGSRPGA